MLWSLVVLGFLSSAWAFQIQPSPITHQQQSKHQYDFIQGINSRTLLSQSASSVEPDSLQSSLRKFQAVNPDAQVLECDADQVQTMNAALWSTLAEVSEADDSQRTCVVLGKIPLSALTSFVTDYANILLESRLVNNIPELQRIRITLLGDDDNDDDSKIVHPALVIESTARTPAELAEKAARSQVSQHIDEAKCTAALKSFVDSMVVGLEACPYTKTADLSATGLEKRGVTSGPVAYRFSEESDAFAAVATFWASVSELLSVPETDISTTLLSLPAIGAGLERKDLDRFAAVVELISRNLCLFRGDDAVGLVHFHPSYERNLFYPTDKPAFGHLPPQSWLRPMLRLSGNAVAAESLTDNDLSLSNFQRRAPHTMINILRASQLNAAVGAKSIVDLELDNGTTEKASGITLYSRNAIRLAKQGKEKLQNALEAIWEKWQ